MMGPFNLGSNCTYEGRYGGHNETGMREMQPYPDISGLGVVASFVGTAYIILVLLVCNFLLAHDPFRPPFQQSKHICPDAELGICPNDPSKCDGGHDAGGWSPNPIDVHFLGILRKRLNISSARVFRMRRIFDECIMDMCDIQVVTGLAILVSGFSLLYQPIHPLSSYHWFIISSLAWFSAVSHLAGLIVLRWHLHRYPWMKTARVVLMGLLLLVLLVALGPTGYFNWGTYGSNTGHEPSSAYPWNPAACFFSTTTPMQLWHHELVAFFIEIHGSFIQEAEYPLTSTNAFQAMVLACAILSFGFISRCVKLFQPLSIAFRRGIRQPVGSLLNWLLEKAAKLPLRLVRNPHGALYRVWFYLVVIPILSLIEFLRFHAHLYSSMFFEVFWISLVLLWGTIKLFAIRASEEIPTHVTVEENAWTFGQIIALLLLAAPLLSMLWKFITPRGAKHCHLPRDTGGAHDQHKTNTEPLVGFPANVALGENFLPLARAVDSNISGSTSQSKAEGDSNPDDPFEIIHHLSKKDLFAKTESWVWPSAATGCGYLFSLTMFMFIATNYNRGGPPTGGGTAGMSVFWYESRGMLIYLLLGYPTAFVASLAPGLELERRCIPCMGWKWALHFLWCVSLQFLYLWSCLADGDNPWIVTPCMYRLCMNHEPAVRHLYNVAFTTLIVYAFYTMVYAIIRVRNMWLKRNTSIERKQVWPRSTLEESSPII